MDTCWSYEPIALPLRTCPWALLRRKAPPSQLATLPQILGAGPILVQNRQIVLDAKAEGFSDAFIRETAARSAIGTTVEGTLLITAVHNRLVEPVPP